VGEKGRSEVKRRVKESQRGEGPGLEEKPLTDSEGQGLISHTNGFLNSKGGGIQGD